MYALPSIAVRTAAAAALLMLFALDGSATGGKLARVTMDYTAGGGTRFGNWRVSANSTVIIGDYNFVVYVWGTSDGTPPFQFKLTSPSGHTIEKDLGFSGVFVA